MPATATLVGRHNSVSPPSVQSLRCVFALNTGTANTTLSVATDFAACLIGTQNERLEAKSSRRFSVVDTVCLTRTSGAEIPFAHSCTTDSSSQIRLVDSFEQTGTEWCQPPSGFASNNLPMAITFP